MLVTGVLVYVETFCAAVMAQLHEVLVSHTSLVPSGDDRSPQAVSCVFWYLGKAAQRWKQLAHVVDAHRAVLESAT